MATTDEQLPPDREHVVDDALRVRFEGPSNGWLGVTVTSGEREWRNAVSYTPNDFLRELITALLSCADYEDATFTAHANTEPEVFLFTFRRRETVIEFTIRENEAVFAVTGTFDAIVMPFWRALRRLQTSFAEDQWRQPFPEREMAALTERVDDARAAK